MLRECEICESEDVITPAVALVDRIWIVDLAVDEGIAICQEHLDDAETTGMFVLVNVVKLPR